MRLPKEFDLMNQEQGQVLFLTLFSLYPSGYKAK
jgi:hypothetical protein